MKLVENWKEVMLRSHSQRGNYLTLILWAMPEVLFLVLGYDLIAPMAWWWAAGASALYSAIGRPIDQGLRK